MLTFYLLSSLTLNDPVCTSILAKVLLQHCHSSCLCVESWDYHLKSSVYVDGNAKAIISQSLQCELKVASLYPLSPKSWDHSLFWFCDQGDCLYFEHGGISQSQDILPCWLKSSARQIGPIIWPGPICQLEMEDVYTREVNDWMCHMEVNRRRTILAQGGTKVRDATGARGVKTRWHTKVLKCNVTQSHTVTL